MPGFLARAVAAFAVLTTGWTMAQPLDTKHARVELLSREDAAVAGGDLLLGVHFVLEPGWHIYWINPGDSGQPPGFAWQTPAGFSTGPVAWPRPERMQSSPQMADYGYHGETLLMVPVHVLKAWAGRTAEIGLDARWLICSDVCLPDHAHLHLSLPAAVSAGDRPDSAALFAAAVRLVPKPLPPGWKADAVSRKNDFVLSVRAPTRAAHAEFFPLDPAEIDNAAPQKALTTSGRVAVTLRKSEYLVKPVAVLRGVLILDDAAYRIEARVTPGKD